MTTTLQLELYRPYLV